MDNIIIAQEVIHSMASKGGRKAWMAIKVDLEKAYNRLEWDYIEETLISIGIPNRFAMLIMKYVRSVHSDTIEWFDYEFISAYTGYPTRGPTISVYFCLVYVTFDVWDQ